MAAVIPEAAGAVEGGTAAVRGASTGAREIRPSRIPAKDRAPFGPEPEGPRRARRMATPVRAAPLERGQQRTGRGGGYPEGGQQKDRQFSRRLKKTGRGALKARLPGSHSYQPVILAEFVTAIVVVSTGPVAKGGTLEAQAKGSASPYSVNTLKQLIAIGMVYFILALLASSRRAGRFAAWFGGLILLGLGFAEYANGDLTAFFKIFGPAATAPQQQGQQGFLAPGAADAFTPGALAQSVGVNENATGAFPVIPPGLSSTAIQQVGGATISTSGYTLPQPGVITSDGGQLA